MKSIKYLTVVSAVLSFLALTALTGTAHAYTYYTYSNPTTTTTTTTYHYSTWGVGLRHARAIALSAQPGRIISQRYVSQGNGERRFVFIIRNRYTGLHHVAVNANNGSLLSNQPVNRVPRSSVYW
jgi:hypothetical protein